VEMSDDFEYQLEQESIEKEAKSGVNSKAYIDPNDGTEYEWNQSMNAWFPKISDEFIAKYQSNYGNFSNEESVEYQNNSSTSGQQLIDDKNSEKIEPKINENLIKSNDKKEFTSKLLNKRKPEQQKPEWFEVCDEHNTKVYVSRLPLDITEEEFVELMKKCGLIMKDDSNQLKVKLYRDSNGNLKGDGLCCYIKIESVELALNILDGYNYKNHIIKVERAKFSLKGDYDPNKKPKRKKKDKQKMKKKIDK
jgi:RNA recognition motif-containing protein